MLAYGCAAVGAAAWLAAAPPGAAEEGSERADTARATWNGSCRSCHTVPDATHETDRAFLRQITETSWTGTEPEVREALIAFLRGDRARKPQTISTAEAEPEAASGTVTADIEHGELFLRPRGDRVGDLRLRWEPGGGTERTVPAGTYAVLGYRRVATADDGVQWIWSTTSPGYRELVVEAGETAHVDVRAAPTVHARAFRARGVERVEVAFRAEKKLGHTLYRDGARIEIRWQCLDGTGAVLAEGPMAYG